MRAPIHSEDLPGHPTGFIRGEVDDCCPRILGFSQSAGGLVPGESLHGLCIADIVHEPESDGVNRHPTSGDFHRKVALESDGSSFARAVETHPDW